MSDEKFPIEQPLAVRAALDRLYPLFHAPRAGRRVNRWIDMCSAGEQARLVNAGAHKPVKELTDAEFKHLAWHAACWDGEHPDTLTYFLPRVLDEYFSFGLNAVPIDFFVSNFRKGGGPAGWANAQRAAVAALMGAAWSAALAVDEGRRGHPRPARDVLWLTAALRLDVGPLLAHWHQTRTTPAAVQLAMFLREEIGSLVPPYTSWWGSIWSDERIEPDVQQQVAGWLLSTGTAEQLEESFFAATDPRTQEYLSGARDLLPP